MLAPALARRGRASSRGFTLVEALVVAGLLALAFGLLAGALGGAMPGQQLREATGRLAAEMRATRARAVATGVDQRFEVDTATREWRSGPSESAESRRSGRLPDALSVVATVAREEQPGPGVAAIRFFADGSSTGGRVVLRRGEAAWRVDVAWLTGAVRIERGEDAR